MVYRKPTSPGQSPAARITQEIIARLEAGTKPWVQPWRGVPVSRSSVRAKRSLRRVGRRRNRRPRAVDGRVEHGIPRVAPGLDLGRGDLGGPGRGDACLAGAA